jgi:hypothetical protein
MTALRARAVFYARCTAIEDLAFGREAGNVEYLRNAVGALRMLFASP